MKTLFGIPVHETEAVGDRVFFLPKVRAIVYVPPQGYTAREMLEAKLKALTDEYEAAARRGEVAMIKNLSA